MNLEQILSQMEGASKGAQGSSVKTASAPAKDAELTAALSKTLEALTGHTEKRAHSPSPVNDLMKIAEQLSVSSMESEKASMSVLGSAFADSAIQKFAAYDAMLQQQDAIDAIHMEKQAALAYNQTMSAYGDDYGDDYREKTAAEEYHEGKEAALQEIHKIATVEFIKGAQEVESLISMVSRGH